MGHLLALGLSGVVAFAFYSTVRLALGNVRWVITLSLQYWTFTSLSETRAVSSTEVTDVTALEG